MKKDELKDRDLVAWARAETIAFTRKKTKFYGTVWIINLIAFSLLLNGMPAHNLAPILGLPLGILLALSSAVALYYASWFLEEWVAARKRNR